MFRRRSLVELCWCSVFFLIGLLLWDQLALSTFGWRRRLKASETEASTCPACYGDTLCNKLDRLYLAPFVQNLFKFGPGNYLRKGALSTPSGERQVVLKRLGRQSEFFELDQGWCKRSLSSNTLCRGPPGKAAELLARQIGSNRTQLLAIAGAKPSVAACVSDRLWKAMVDIYDINKDKKLSPREAAMLMTTLAVNAEPIVLKLFPAVSGWPFPYYHGACGRMIVVEDCDVSLGSAFTWSWRRRVQVALSLMVSIEKLAKNSERYIVHLLDLSVQNFAICADGCVKVVDAENILAVDLDTVPSHHPLPQLITQTSCEENNMECQMFSEEDLCAGGSRDFNYLFTCRNILQGKVVWKQNGNVKEWSGLLHSPPESIKTNMSILLQKCAIQSSNIKRSVPFNQLLYLLKQDSSHNG